MPLLTGALNAPSRFMAKASELEEERERESESETDSERGVCRSAEVT